MDSFERALPSDADSRRFAYDFDAFRTAKNALVAEIEALEADVSKATSVRTRGKLTDLRRELEQHFHRFEWAVFGKVTGPPDRETVELAKLDYVHGQVEIRGGDVFIGQSSARRPSSRVIGEAERACKLLDLDSSPFLVQVAASWNHSDGAPCYAYQFRASRGHSLTDRSERFT